MKLKFIFLLHFFALISSAQIMWQIDKDSVRTWYYQEGDEFNGETLNKNYWSDWYGWGRSISGNKEQQYYTKWKNHFVKDGILTLTAKKEDIHERYVDWMGDNDSIFNGKKYEGLNKRKFTYAAGMLQSLHDFQYGYFECKFKIPAESGFWPAFWLYGGSPNEEIDWMELKTEKYNQIHVGRHAQKREENYISGFLGKKTVWGDWVKFNGSLTNGYNIISGEWSPTCLKYYLNGECIAITNVKFNEPKKLVANIAVSSTKGAFPPAPNKDFKDSVNFEVDYIRVWTRNEGQAKKLANKKLVVEESIIGTVELNKSALVSKSKIHYGKESLHVNEGLFASLMSQGNSKYQFTVLGKIIPANSKFTLKNEEGKVIYSSPLKYGISTLDLLKYNLSELTLSIEVFGKQTSYKFMVY